MENISAPTCRAPRLSAASPPTGAATGAPARSASCSAGQPSGSTLTIAALPAYQAAIPPISPPPPVATSTCVSSGASSSNSRPTVPCPASTAGWS